MLVRQAETPRALVIRRAIWDHVRLLGKRVESLAQRREGKLCPYRLAVRDDVQRGASVVDDPRAVGGRDVCVADVPLVRHDPLEHPRAARDLDPRDRNLFLEDVEGGPHAFAREAAAQREQPAHQLVAVAACDLGSPRAFKHRGHANTALRQKNASAYELGELHSIPRSLSRLEKSSSRNHRLESWVPKWLIRWSILRWRRRSSSGTNAFGALMSPSYFGTSYSRIRWSRKVFQVSSQLTRWSWCRSARWWVKTTSGERSAFSSSKKSLICSP